MKHLIILSLLTLPLIACKSLNTHQEAPEAPEDPVVSNPMIRAIDELRKIVKWDSININTDDPEYDTYTFNFRKTYQNGSSGSYKAQMAINLYERLCTKAKNLTSQHGLYEVHVKPWKGGMPPVINRNKSIIRKDNQKIKADLGVSVIHNTFTLNMTLTLPKLPKETLIQLGFCAEVP